MNDLDYLWRPRAETHSQCSSAVNTIDRLYNIVMVHHDNDIIHTWDRFTEIDTY